MGCLFVLRHYAGSFSFASAPHMHCVTSALSNGQFENRWRADPLQTESLAMTNNCLHSIPNFVWSIDSWEVAVKRYDHARASRDISPACQKCQAKPDQKSESSATTKKSSLPCIVQRSRTSDALLHLIRFDFRTQTDCCRHLFYHPKAKSKNEFHNFEY